MQDRQGLMWFATTKGLVSYDGYQFRLFDAKLGQQVDPNGAVKKIVEDHNGGLWIGTDDQGLIHYRKQDQTSVLFQHQADNVTTLSSNRIFALANETDKALWVGTDKGLNRFDFSTNQIRRFQSQTDQDSGLPDDFIAALLIEDDGQLWVGTNRGIVRKSATSTDFHPVDFATAKSHRVKVLFQASDKRIYVGTINGLFSYDQRQGKLVEVNLQLTAKYIYSITEDGIGNLWVGTVGKGLYQIDKDQAVTHYRYDKGNPYSISDDSIIALTADSSGTLWAGTFNSGLSRLDLLSLQFKFYDDSRDSYSCLKNPVVYSIQRQDPNILWLGTQTGLAKIDLVQNHCQLYSSDRAPANRLRHRQIASLYIDDKKSLWVGTLRGLNRLPYGATQFEAVDGGFPAITAYDFAQDQAGDMFVASYKGLYRKKHNVDQFAKVKAVEPVSHDVYISQLALDPQGQLWLASDDGLLMLNQDTQIESVSFNSGYDLSKPIKAMAIDHRGWLWLGIEGVGLVVLDSNGTVIKALTDSQQLKAVAGFAAIVEASDGSMWISSTKGLEQINPVDWQLTFYGSDDGLQSPIFTRGAKLSGQNRLYFGGRKGLTQFNPAEIKRNELTANVQINRFLYFNQPLLFGDKSGQFTLPEPIDQIETLNLSYRDHDFGFEFSALHYANAKQNQYAYKLENWDKKWIYTDANYRRASYSNLAAGDYVFKVKASNNHGLWNKTAKTINIHISPPPWATPWAFTLYIVAALLLVFGLIKFRTQSLEKRSRQLEVSVKKRTAELATEKNKVEQLLSRKNEEFANVSHEFRTPLTLILGPLAQVLKSDINDQASNRLSIVQRNAFRLLRMVDQLLNLETFRVKAITQKSPQATGKIIGLIAEAFIDLAEEKQISLTVNTIADVNFELTPDALEKIILNLLSNAIKYSKPGDVITIESIRTTNNRLQVTVSDTGIGIPADKLDSVFERYNRVLDENSEKVTGAGIGLALVKNLVEAHQGNIEIASKLGQGTTITLSLPIIGEVAEAQLASHANDEIIAMELMSLAGQKSQTKVEEMVTVIADDEKPSVLVIEDNQDMRDYIVSNIADKYQISTAVDGEHGLAKAISEVPDLIISDVMMPKMDGYQATHALKTNDITNHIPIILLTARGDRESRLKGWHQKADEYLTKPFDVEELNIRLNNLLEIRNILKQRFCEVVFEPQLAVEQPSTEQPEIDAEQSHKQLQQQKFIEKLNEILEPMYADSDMAIEDIAAAFAIGERQFFRKLKSILDMTPSEYLRRFRLDKAKSLLREGKTASFTAFEVGFSSQSYFGKCFKDQFGMSPNEFRKQ